MSTAFGRAALQIDEDYAGQVLREASLDEVEHYFVYNADHYAAAYLGAPEEAA